MEEKALIFGKKSINKNSFYKNKKPIRIGKAENRKVVLSIKDSYDKKGSFKYSFKYSIQFYSMNKTDAFPIPLFIKLPQVNGYIKHFNSNNKYINILFHYENLLNKDNELWDKISNLLKKEFDSEPVYDNKYIKSKIKIYKYRTNTNL